MFGSPRRENRADIALKENLLRQLSHAVKEVQLHFSKTRETCSTQECASSLLTALETIFLHGLKRSLLESALRKVSETEGKKPNPSFFNAMSTISPKATITQIRSLNQVTTDVGRSRAWIRITLNEGTIHSYLAVMPTDRQIAKTYRPGSFLRDRETLDTAGHLLEGLLPVPFDIPLNSSLLNTWTSDPLLLSGLWDPAIRPCVQVAVDVAGNIDEDDTCSIVTASSSVKSLFTLDEAHAIQLILSTPMSRNEQDQPNAEDDDVEKEMAQLEQERHDIMERSYSQLVASVSPQTEPIFPTYLTDPAPVEKENEVEVEEPTSTPRAETPPLPEPSAPRSNTTDVEDYEKIFANNQSNIDANQIAQDTSIEQEGDKTNSLEIVIQKIPQEKGLRQQNYECADCQLSISLNFGPAILCHVRGLYLCEMCHKLDLNVVPARIIYNWDHTKYPVGKKAMEFITSSFTTPIFDLSILNPKLYSAVKEVREIFQKRKQLSLLNLYLTTCKEQLSLPIREYIYDSPNLYSISDITSIPGGVIKAEIEKTLSFGKSHVLGCWICKAKGFICEVCRDPQVIYPFDDEAIYRCHKCKAVYHGQCLSRERNCPKCRRKKRREVDCQD